MAQLHIFSGERRQRPQSRDTNPSPNRDETGPSRPDVKKPTSKKLLDRMKRVDPEQAKKYRQRSGQ